MKLFTENRVKGLALRKASPVPPGQEPGGHGAHAQDRRVLRRRRDEQLRVADQGRPDLEERLVGEDPGRHRQPGQVHPAAKKGRKEEEGSGEHRRRFEWSNG